MPTNHAKRRAQERGSTLLVTVVLMVVVTLVALGTVKRNSEESDAVAAKRRYDQAVTCADGARQMLMGQMNIYGLSPQLITMDRSVAGQRYATGHYDNYAVTTVQVASGTQVGVIGVTDVANRISQSRLGGQIYRVTVVCSAKGATDSQQDEVEFLVRLGI